MGAACGRAGPSESGVSTLDRRAPDP